MLKSNPSHVGFLPGVCSRYRESPNPDSLGHALETRFEQLKVMRDGSSMVTS
jgi:hypothetical protein